MHRETARNYVAAAKATLGDDGAARLANAARSVRGALAEARGAPSRDAGARSQVALRRHASPRCMMGGMVSTGGDYCARCGMMPGRGECCAQCGLPRARHQLATTRGNVCTYCGAAKMGRKCLNCFAGSDVSTSSQHRTFVRRFMDTANVRDLGSSLVGLAVVGLLFYAVIDSSGSADKNGDITETTPSYEPADITPSYEPAYKPPDDIMDPAEEVRSPFFRNCRDAHRHGVYGIRRGDRRYSEQQDGDHDGIACE